MLSHTIFNQSQCLVPYIASKRNHSPLSISPSILLTCLTPPPLPPLENTKTHSIGRNLPIWINLNYCTTKIPNRLLKPQTSWTSLTLSFSQTQTHKPRNQIHSGKWDDDMFAWHFISLDDSRLSSALKGLVHIPTSRQERKPMFGVWWSYQGGKHVNMLTQS